jgi:hypothetical protein
VSLLDAFIATNDGRFVDVDHVFGPQCVDLVDQWAKELGAPLPGVVGAKDLASKEIAGYIFIVNTDTNVPSAGDIVVWNEKVGDPNGHTAIFIEGNDRNFTSFDENFPRGSACHRQFHDYKAVVGWHHFNRVIDVPPPPAPSPTTFTGTVSADGGAHVRTLPGTEHPIVPQPGPHPDVVDKGIRLTFDAWTHHGPPIPDAITGQGDDRWFRTALGHWVASATITGNPPPGMGPIPDPAG